MSRAQAKGHLLEQSGVSVDRVEFILQSLGKIKEKLGDGLLLGLRQGRDGRDGGEARQHRP